jgi:hypothetical protein
VTVPTESDDFEFIRNDPRFVAVVARMGLI